MRFDTKIAVVVRAELPIWQKLNMTAFLVSGIAAVEQGIVGEPYVDASGNSYLPMFRQPVLVFGATAEQLQNAYRRAQSRAVPLAIFTEDLFATGNDEDNRAAVRGVPADELRLVGLALHAPRNTVDKIVKGLALHT
jgi:hypothetical protein